jgi:hypothetical protein
MLTGCNSQHKARLEVVMTDADIREVNTGQEQIRATFKHSRPSDNRGRFTREQIGRFFRRQEPAVIKIEFIISRTHKTPSSPTISIRRHQEMDPGSNPLQIRNSEADHFH